MEEPAKTRPVEIQMPGRAKDVKVRSAGVGGGRGGKPGEKGREMYGREGGKQ